MRAKTILVFFAAVAASSALAMLRFGDSGHAMGMLSLKGGKVRHAVHLTPGKRQYVVALTGTVQPPYRGNARLTVEGQPEMDCEISSPGPVIDLGLRRRPLLHDNVLEDLQPKDRFSLWVVMRPRNTDWAHNTDQEGQQDSYALRNTLTLRDTETGRPLLEVPIVYGPEKERSNVEQE
jgi:hypothetical protein